MKLVGICRLGRDAEVRYTQSGKAVANLHLAYNVGRKDEQKAQWVEASLWGDQAERLAPHLVKGTALNLILRDVHIETYEGRNGQGAKLVGTVLDLEFAGGRKKDDESRNPATPAERVNQRQQSQAIRQAAPYMDDDIPF